MIIGGVVASSRRACFGGWLRWGRVVDFDNFGVFIILRSVVVVIVIATSSNLTQSQLVIVVTHSFCY